MASTYNTDHDDHVMREAVSIHDAASASVTSASVTSAAPPHRKSTTYSIRVVHFTLLFIQLGYAGYQILARVALVDGLSPYMFTIYRNIVAWLLIGPLAYYVERKSRPQLTFSILWKFQLLGLTGIVGSQQLFLAGLSLTSPLFAAVCQNLIPVFTFLLAVSFGLEEVRILRRDGIAKVLGTIICISGATTMSVYKGMVIIQQQDKVHMNYMNQNFFQLGAAAADVYDNYYTQPFRNLGTVYGLSGSFVEYKISNFHLGIICVLLDTFAWAAFLILQKPILEKYPAPLTVNVFTSVFGVIQVVLVGALWEGNLKFLDFNLSSSGQVIGVLYAGIIGSSVNYVLQSWCVKRAGPFLAALYNPVQMLLVAALAVLTLGDTVYLGTLVGAILIVGGFYTVVYGQRAERRFKEEDLRLKSCSKSLMVSGESRIQVPESEVSDLERPLLDSNHNLEN